MVENNQYDPEVYKRLELVRKQFRHIVAEQKKQQAAGRNQRVLSALGSHKVVAIRFTVYAVLAVILIAMVTTRISEIFFK